MHCSLDATRPGEGQEAQGGGELSGMTQEFIASRAEYEVIM